MFTQILLSTYEHATAHIISDTKILHQMDATQTLALSYYWRVLLITFYSHLHIV